MAYVFRYKTNSAMEVKKFESSEGNVWKYVFHFENAIAESVLYRYGTFSERTVMCVSIQSGCPVGCTFCGTGKNFIRSLSADEIVQQVNYLVNDVEQMEYVALSRKAGPHLATQCKKFQIMFMSMGEPMLNWKEMDIAIMLLNHYYSDAQLLISTIGIDDEEILFKMLELSTKIKKIGLQFSIHDAFDEDRDNIIPFKKKLTLRDIRNYGLYWSVVTGRSVYLNYCISESSSKREKLERLMDIFDPEHFHFTFSVICEKEEGKNTCENLEMINEISDLFLSKGYNVRVFNPAGKDDIGGGCGQLHYVQSWMKTHIKYKQNGDN